MRNLHLFFLVSVALFITGIGFVIAGAREARRAGPADAAEASAAGTPVATIKQIMAGITGPAANVVYNAVGTIVGAEGVKEIAPQNDAEWAVVGNSAAALVESGNLMLMSGRAIDSGDWVKMTRSFMDASTKAVKAAEAKDTELILGAGAEINDTCDTCHERYQRQ